MFSAVLIAIVSATVNRFVKARSNGSNMLVKHHPTLLGGVGRCLISVGLCWLLECSNESNTIQQCWISVPDTKLWRIFENVGRCWMKSLNKVKLHPTSSNTVQRYSICLICCSNESNMLRPAIFHYY